ncbi:Putative ethanolamine kinase [Komagataella phaffii CBS 7435]|uniref:ethanolamine kinase n=1 Tax=Komagataella phaffii (strain ATCC 76273 / CBS 7435 / CECT 11047 / NRRL Y-11430 / Wegner 21-1) TaxID=981350 RepID=F2QV72_KOMPC|nr:GQ67_03962T0 [Komagataella phaffii]AOA68498.1 GQ68_03936T0 [Komagataella phaffii GS115]CAH2449287.1 Putative ethanolamine kinase [Komagataella phaffii CBS 7435]CCA39300.1 Putative ethanolamine kinase [Komagataella phaffii CBS 7435]
MTSSVYCLVSSKGLEMIQAEQSLQLQASALYLPNIMISFQHEIKTESDKQFLNLLERVFPEWKKSKIELQQLTGGITNMLLLASCTSRLKKEHVLIRTYGKGTDMIIDRDREFVSQLLLNNLGLAPQIFSRFGNGLVYGYLEGRSLTPEELSDPTLYPLIAQRLGQWHNIIDKDEIENALVKLKSFTNAQGASQKFSADIWQLLEAWINILPPIKELEKSCLENKDILQDTHDKLDLQAIFRKELEWIKSQISNKSPTVTCHCDLLSGNVILRGTPTSSKLPTIENNPILFIDYEYVLPGPRAFDIANHLVEWQGFECDQSRILDISQDNPILRSWVRSYVSASVDKQVDEADVSQLIDEISLFFGLPGFYWGIWAGIQSKISLIEFDYSEYCALRLQEYWTWKREYLTNL